MNEKLINKTQFLNASIVIPTLGRLNQTIKLSRVLLKLEPHPLEIIIVFQDKNEHEAFKILKISEIIKPILILQKSAVRARNAGMSVAVGEYIAFLDDDCIPTEPNWLAKITEPLVNPRIGLVTGSVQGWEGISGKLPFVNKAFLLIPIILEPTGNPECETSNYCSSVAGGNFAVRRSDFVLLGGFNENFDSPSLYEEIELSLRMKKRFGKKIWYESSASVSHSQSKTGGMRAITPEFSQEFVIGQRIKLFNELNQNRTITFVRIYTFLLFHKIYKVLKKLSSIYYKNKSNYDIY